MDLPEITQSRTTSFVDVPASFPFSFTVPVMAPNVISGMNELVVDINGRRFISKQSATFTDNGGSDSYYFFDEMTTETVKASPGQTVRFIRIVMADKTDALDRKYDPKREYNQFIRRGSQYQVTITRLSYAYFIRENLESNEWIPVSLDELNVTQQKWLDPIQRVNVKRYVGRNALNFAWFHITPRYHLVDPSPTNIMDMFVVTRGYYEQVRRWLRGETSKPVEPSSLELRSSYEQLLESRMISDSVIVHSGKFKILFGAEALPQLRATFKLIKSANGRFTDNELKVRVVDVIRNFFDIDQWEFGEAFYGTELIAAIHASLPGEIDSIVIVPDSQNHVFGELFEIIPQEDELFQPHVSVSSITIVDHYNSKTLKQR
jgi:hypothetical protein